MQDLVIDSSEKILVVGAGGQLGRYLCKALNGQAVALPRAALDVTDRDAVMHSVRRVRPVCVINASAYTNVDRAEQDPLGCRAVNVDGVAHLAEACRELDCTFVQISTDYVFGKDRQRETPYLEDDRTAPLNVYGQSKLAGERHATSVRKHIVARSCGLYGPPDPGVPSRNFASAMLRLSGERNEIGVVNDQICTPTYIPHLAAAILYLLAHERFGLFHITNTGHTSWYDFAAEIFRRCNRQVALSPISTEQYAAVADRPRYSVLEVDKYHGLGGPRMPTWQDALGEWVATFVGESLGTSQE